ncbi:MAG: CoA transferase, partial [Acidimicrobiia bacterium]|nr:CoA transferase [Acidimicrobiia bacterium]
AIGRADLAVDARLVDVDARRARAAEIDTAIEAWTSTRGPRDAETALQALGVPAHEVVNADSEDDPQLEHLRHTVVIPHEGRPDRMVERTRIELVRTPPDPHHVPAMGQHVEDVLGGILGYDEARIASLRSCGALGGQPNR